MSRELSAVWCHRLVLATVVLSACTFSPFATPDPRMRPDQIVVDPAEAVPGDVVGIGFPDEITRGILFVLERRTADGWLPAFFLTSDGSNPGAELTWQPPGGAGLAVDDIGVGGPGPDHVLIPDEAQPGNYRICTANAAEDVCAPIEILPAPPTR
jgi:hypothetical protein